jgi:hypothetical protein
MEDMDIIDLVDRFGERLRDKLKEIGKSGTWGAEFQLSRPSGSDYHRAQVMIAGKAVRKNFIQLNGHVSHNPAYSTLKILARFGSPPGNPIWGKKETQEDKQGYDWSLSGPDVYTISYDNLAKALLNQKEEDVLEELLADLRLSCSYSNKLELSEDSADSWQPPGRVDVTLSIDAAVWSDFQQLYVQRYRSRKKHPKRPSYAELRDDAVNAAFRDYLDKCKSMDQAERTTNGK